mmetsp:Transcript_4461/g.8157  ORF Transcript_4461/g.8157 Transcript_4461/m.8157 type:complete len:90 (+) Transcript_4461:739-1008(+)
MSFNPVMVCNDMVRAVGLDGVEDGLETVAYARLVLIAAEETKTDLEAAQFAMASLDRDASPESPATNAVSMISGFEELGFAKHVYNLAL